MIYIFVIFRFYNLKENIFLKFENLEDLKVLVGVDLCGRDGERIFSFRDGFLSSRDLRFLFWYLLLA